MKKEITPQECAIRLLSVRGYSEKELLFKLIGRQIHPAAAALAVAECKRLGYLNDEQLSEDYAGVLSHRGYGPKMMKLQLYKKGIGSELIASTLDNENLDHIQSAREAALYKLRLLSRETDLRKKREKVYRFLLGRGFHFDTVKQVCDELAEHFANPQD